MKTLNSPFKNRRKLASFVSILSIAVISFVDGATSFALQSYYKSNLSTELYKVDFLGKTSGEQFGASVATGDINGDDIDDLVVGSPFYSSIDRTWNGKVSVFLGAPSIANKLVDLKEVYPDVEIYGKGDGDQLGMSLDCGDFNGDGYDDLLIGAYNASSDDIRTGKAFLLFGKKDVEFSIIDLALPFIGIEFIGDDDGDAFSMAVKMADINRDGLKDVLIGAPFAVSTESTNNEKTGNVYGYFGFRQNMDIVDSCIKLFGERDANVIFSGHEKGERFGSAIEVNNFIRGTFADIAISAYFSDGDAGKQVGKVYLYSGTRRYKKYVNLQDDVLEGSEEYGWFGFSMTSKNITLDTYSDLMISSFPYANRTKRGSSYILYGRESFGKLEEDGITRMPFNVTFDNADYGFIGGRGDSFLGADLGIGDFNMDGKNDFVIGAPGIGIQKASDPGELYFYYKGALPNRMPFNVKNDEFTSLVRGDYPDDWFGAKLTILDYNNDGYDDIAVSSRYADRYDAQTGKLSESSNGKVTILLGHSSPFGELITKPEPGDEPITRGAFVSAVVEKFNIKEKRKDFIDDCYLHREFCFFTFMGMSNFDGIKLNPNIILYPDVSVNSKYYEPITVATLLGAVSGNASEFNTPFKPESPITRIQALKIILSLNQLVKPMYKFELVSELGDPSALYTQRSSYQDVDSSIPGNWWYPRFANYAYDNWLIDDRRYFRPDDLLTVNEMTALIDRTLSVIGQT